MKDYILNIKGAERRFSNNLPEVRTEGESRKVRGLGIVYNSLSENFMPGRPGGLYEMIAPEASRGLLDNEDIMILYNHDPNLVLARNKNTATLTDTPEGVYYEYESPNTTVANDLLENLRLKNVRKSSFAFIPKEVVMEKRSIEGLGDVNIRLITKFQEFRDFSVVVYPAYNDTEVMARAIQDLDEVEKRELKRLRKQQEYEYRLFKLKHK